MRIADLQLAHCLSTLHLHFSHAVPHVDGHIVSLKPSVMCWSVRRRWRGYAPHCYHGFVSYLTARAWRKQT